jgi:hypothetical protein
MGCPRGIDSQLFSLDPTFTDRLIRELGGSWFKATRPDQPFQALNRASLLVSRLHDRG